MTNKSNPKRIINEARYGFRGTDRCFYEFQLLQSKQKFGREGLYSSRTITSYGTSITLNPVMAMVYAENSHEKALSMYDEGRINNMKCFFNSRGIKTRGKFVLAPIILIIDLKNYKDEAVSGVEFHPLMGNYEFEITGPISLADIQVIRETHINNLESYLAEINSSMPDISTLEDGSCVMNSLFPNQPRTISAEDIVVMKHILRKFLSESEVSARNKNRLISISRN